MNNKNQMLIIGALAVAAATTLFTNAARADENAFEALPGGVEAYIYGYPLVTMEMTRRVMTNVREAGRHAAPMGQFVRVRRLSRTPDTAM